MSRTFVQQSQISGSLSYDDTLAAGSALASKQTLVDDLNSLRSQMNKIIGKTNWFDALDGSQDLADIYAAVHMTGTAADFQGTLDVTGVATFDAAITGSAGLQLTGDLDVNSTADFQGAVNLQDTLTVAQAADLNGSLDVAGQVDLAAAGVATNVRGTLSVTEVASFSAAITGSAGLKLAGDADFNSSADFQGAVNMQSTLAVAQKADFADIVDVAGTLSASAVKIDGDVVGRLYLVGSEGEIQDSDKLFFDGSLFQVTGSMGVSGGLNVASGGLTVAGDRLEVTGSFGLTGDAAIGGKLDVAGILDVASTLSASAIKIDGDVAQRLYIVDADGSLKDESKLTFDGSELWVDGDLEVAGGDITLSNSMSISSATAGKLVLTSDLVETSGDLKVGGNDISGSAGLNITLESAGDVTIAGDLKLMGNELKSSAGNVVLELSGDDAFFKSDVHVAGDLYVKGAMTYIETSNLKVQDAFIHLATGSTGAENSGIVLHGGAGATDDLMLAQDGGAGEFVFAKLAHGQDHTDVDGDNSVTVNGAVLVPAWMSSIKVGGVEGSLSGSLAVAAGGISLTSEAGKNIAVTAGDATGGDLLLSANGETAISFIESGEYALFNAQFPGSSLVAAIVAAGGNFKQDSFLPGAVVAGTAIDFEAALGIELRSAAVADVASKKVAMDVYLNGVRLAYGEDYTIESTKTIELTMSTMEDDRILVAIHNAA